MITATRQDQGREGVVVQCIAISIPTPIKSMWWMAWGKTFGSPFVYIRVKIHRRTASCVVIGLVIPIYETSSYPPWTTKIGHINWTISEETQGPVCRRVINQIQSTIRTIGCVNKRVCPAIKTFPRWRLATMKINHEMCTLRARVLCFRNGMILLF